MTHFYSLSILFIEITILNIEFIMEMQYEEIIFLHANSNWIWAISLFPEKSTCTGYARQWFQHLAEWVINHWHWLSLSRCMIQTPTGARKNNTHGLHQLGSATSDPKSSWKTAQWKWKSTIVFLSFSLYLWVKQLRGHHWTSMLATAPRCDDVFV